MSETLITWAQRRGQIKHLLYELCLSGRIDKSTLFAQFYDLNNVEPIVRCKDCKHFAKWGKNVAPDTGYYCIRPNQQTCNLVPEDYCSYAERKNEVGE